MSHKYCGECTGGFLIKKDEHGNNVAYDCPKCKVNRNKEELETKMLHAGIPPLYWQYTFSSYMGVDENKSKEILMSYTDRIDTPAFRGMGVYITGGKSCQKTTMMCVLGKELLSKGKQVKFIAARDLVSMMIKTAGFKSVAVDELKVKMDSYINSSYLLIDDLFSMGASAYWSSNEELIKAEWNRVLRYRSGKYLQTAITSPLTLEQVAETVSEDISAVLCRGYKELIFNESLEKVLMGKIDKIFEV